MTSSHYQRTVGREGSISGIGLHSGETCSISLKPASVDFGVQFFRKGHRVQGFSSDLRCTAIGRGTQQILTVEHLLAALGGLCISNVRIDVTGPEIPGLDGSALPFVRFLKSLGFAEQRKRSKFFKITEPLFCSDKNRAIAVYPADELRVAYVLDYPHPRLRAQMVDFLVTPEIFEKDIAPARTFCTEEEANALRKKGLGEGADFKNTLVIGNRGVLKNHLRFPDECARHKVLDLIGDLNGLGFSLLGRVVGIRSGHSLNARLVLKIREQKEGLQR